MSRMIVDTDKIAVLRNAGRIWAVASVHGEAERLAALQQAIAERFETGDRLVYLGNLYGRGAQVLETIDTALAFRRAVIGCNGMFAADVAILRGSQEEMWQKLLQLQLALSPVEVLTWMLDHGVGATLEAYGGRAEEGLSAARSGAAATARWTAALRDRVQEHGGHAAMMSALRRAAVSEAARGGERILFVNAGLDPSRPLETQKDSFWWPSKAFETLAEPYGDFLRVVRGCDPRRRGVCETPFTASLDAGCGFGGPLVAGCFDATGALVDTLDV